MALTLDRGRARLDRLTRALGWVLPVAGGLLAVVLVGGAFTVPTAPINTAFALLSLLMVVTCMTGMTLSCMWLYRANANLHAAGLPMNHGPTMAWLWSFVPVASLFKPYQVVREIWTDSLRQHDSFSGASSPLLAQWWSTWVVGMVALNLANNGLIAQTVAGRMVLAPLGGLAVLAACLLFRQITRTVNEAQQGIVDVSVFA